MSILSNTPSTDLYNRWRWLYAGVCTPDENGQLKSAVSEFKSSDIEHYGPSNNLNKINWLSFDDLEDNHELMDSRKVGFLRALCDVRYHYNTAENKNSTLYMGNAILMTMADNEYSREICQCGTTGTGVTANKKPCSKRKYCDRCANTKRRFIYSKYADAYNKEIPSYFITLTVDLEHKVKFIDGNLEQVLHEWDRLNGYVDAMYKNKIITGGIRCEELSIDKLYPHAVVNPHLHVLCQGLPNITSHTFDGMKIDVRPVKDRDDWVTKMNYVYKAMDLYSTYVREWNVQHGEVINRNLRDCLDNHKFIVKNRNQTRAFGSFYAGSKNCVAASIKNVKANKNKPLQKPKAKINYTKEIMYEDFKKGVEKTIKKPITSSEELFKVAFTELNTPAPAKKERPWYKNPWVVGGAGLAAGAGLYGAGKMFNGGNNPLNNTFGKGVDDYLVNPVKGLFAPKMNPLASTLSHDPGTTKLVGNLADQEANLSNYLARLKTINTDEDAEGTMFDGASRDAINKITQGLSGSTKYEGLTPEIFKQFQDYQALTGKTHPMIGELQNAGDSTDFTNWLKTQGKTLTPGEQSAQTARGVLGPYALGDIGVALASHIPKIKNLPGLGALSKATGALSLPIMSAFGAVDGYDHGDRVGGTVKLPGGIDTGVSNAAAHTVGGAAMPVLGGLLGRSAAGMLGSAALGAEGGSLVPGLGTILGAIAGATAYPINSAIRSSANKAFEMNMGGVNDVGTIVRQFMDARRELEQNQNPLPLAGLKQSLLFKKFTDDPSKYRAPAGAELTPEQIDDTSLAPLMYLKNTSDPSQLAGKSIHDMLVGGRQLLRR